jgi:hypothetical protein
MHKSLIFISAPWVILIWSCCNRQRDHTKLLAAGIGDTCQCQQIRKFHVGSRTHFFMDIFVITAIIHLIHNEVAVSIFSTQAAVIQLQSTVRLGQAQIVAADGGEIIAIRQIGTMHFFD